MSTGVRFGDPVLPMLVIERSVRRAILDVAVAVEARAGERLALAAGRLRWLVRAAERLAADGSPRELAQQLARVRMQAEAWLPVSPGDERGMRASDRPGAEGAGMRGVRRSERLPSGPIESEAGGGVERAALLPTAYRIAPAALLPTAYRIAPAASSSLEHPDQLPSPRATERASADGIALALSDTLLLTSDPDPVDATDAELVILDLDALDLAGILLRGALLVDVTGRRAVFDAIDATGARVLDCRFFGSSFHGGTFDGATITDSDLSCANLSATRWRGTELSSCTLLGSRFTDANLNGATFIDCDLRATHFDVATYGGSRGARFERCDLRETRWTGRALAGATFVDCKLFGAHGTALADDILIVRPDLSPLGDGSQIGERADVLASWRSARGAAASAGVAAITAAGTIAHAR